MQESNNFIPRSFAEKAKAWLEFAKEARKGRVFSCSLVLQYFPYHPFLWRNKFPWLQFVFLFDSFQFRLPFFFFLLLTLKPKIWLSRSKSVTISQWKNDGRYMGDGTNSFPNEERCRGIYTKVWTTELTMK